MNCVETASTLNERLDPPEVRAHQSLRLAPEQPVVDDEKLCPLCHGMFEGSQTGVHSERHSLDLGRPFNLQTVLRLILDLSGTKVFIKVIDQSFAFHSVIPAPSTRDSRFDTNTTLRGAQ
jgi:hypothetical protein